MNVSSYIFFFFFFFYSSVSLSFYYSCSLLRTPFMSEPFIFASLFPNHPLPFISQCVAVCLSVFLSVSLSLSLSLSLFLSLSLSSCSSSSLVFLFLSTATSFFVYVFLNCFRSLILLKLYFVSFREIFYHIRYCIIIYLLRFTSSLIER